ncbi:hypothetical protein [Microbulbifer harenosus]|uniref:hypothetical protein n=1 Tax=Microbulbifer harenosus TaxID=2576840 RepID=UPI001C7053D8|nr:hypothetical protein [Microbulbifer harenosus]
MTSVRGNGSNTGDHLDASGYSAALALTGTDRELTTGDGLIFRELNSAIADSLRGSALADNFIVQVNNVIEARGIDFSGVTTISAGGTNNIATGLAAVDWQLQDSDSASNSGIRFDGFRNLVANNAGLVGTAGDDTFTLTGSSAADAEVQAHDMVFSGLTSVRGNGSNTGDHLDASGYSAALALTGTDRELTTGDGLIFRELNSAIADSLRGSALADNFIVQANNVIEARGIDFSGVTTITAGGTNNIATGLAAVDWQLQDSDSASNSGIRFDGFRNLVANNAGLVGTAGDDTFTLTGSSAADAEVQVHDMVFSGLTSVRGNGSVNGDHLDALGYNTALALTGTDRELTTGGGLTFRELNSAEFESLDGHSGDDSFEVTGAKTVSVAGLTVSGLSDVRGNGGANNLKAADTVTLDEEGYASAGSIRFYDLGEIETDTLVATSKDDALEFATNGVLVNRILVKASTIDGAEGDETIVGVVGQDWTLVSANSAKNNGVTFKNVETVVATGAGLNGTEGGDRFTLNSDGTITAGDVTVREMTFVDGKGGNDDLDAADFSAGLGLNSVAGVFTADTLTLRGIETATTGILTGTGGDDQFIQDSSGAITTAADGSVAFTVNSELKSGGGSDSFNSTFNQNWVLQDAARGVELNGLAFTDIFSLTGGSGVIQGHANGHDFTLLGNKAVEVGNFQFHEITAVSAGAGVDDVVAIGEVALTGEGNAFTTSGIKFTGINTSSSSSLTGSTSAETFTFSADGTSLNVSGIDFRDLVSVAAGDGRDTVIAGNDREYTLSAEGIVDHTGVNFTQVEEFQAGGAGNIDASNFSAGLALTGNNGEVEAGGATFTGISTAIANSLRGSAQADNFVVQANNEVGARGIGFTGVTTITAGGTGNIATGLAAIDWQLQDSDSASNSGIRFDGFRNFVANNAGLVGTAGDDTFTLTGNSAADAEVQVEDMVFRGLTSVRGNGSVNGDHLDALGYNTALALTGTNRELTTGDGLIFRELNSAEFESLDGHSGDDSFEVTGAKTVSVAELTVSGLSEVRGKGGTNSLIARGSSARLSEEGYVESRSIQFYDIDKITANALEATEGKDELSIDEHGIVTINGYEISETTQVDAKGGEDTVIGASGMDWTIVGEKSAEGKGVTFKQIEMLKVAADAGLVGTGNADVFTLNSDGSIRVASIDVSGMEWLDGGGGADQLLASEFSGGLALHAKPEVFTAGDLKISHIAQASATSLTGTSGDDVFKQGEDGWVTANSATSLKFSISGRIDGAAGRDRFESELQRDWVLASGAASVGYGVLDIFGVEVFLGSGQHIQGHASGHNFAVLGTNQVGIGDVTFNGIHSIGAAGGTDHVSAIAEVALAAAVGGINTSGINFSGIDSVTAAALAGSSGADTFVLSGAGALRANGIAFSGLTSVAAGTGDDTVLSRADHGYELDADSGVQHDGIRFAGIELFQGQNASLAVSGQDNAQITANGSVTSGTVSFTGLKSLTLDGSTNLQAWNGVTVEGAGEATSGGIFVSGVTSVSDTGALTGTSGDDVFTVSGTNSLSTSGMNFSGVSAVAAGAGSDTVAGDASHDWLLSPESGSLTHAEIAFTGLEQVTGGSGVIQGADSDSLYVLASDGSVQAGGIAFADIQSVRAGARTDRVETESGERWELGSTAGSASVSGITFSAIEQIGTDAALVDASQNDISESFFLSADGAEISVFGLIFDRVAEVYAGGEGGNEVTSSAGNWQLASGGQVSANGVAFHGIDRVNADNAVLTGTSAAEQFALTGVDGELSTAGIQFSGIGAVEGNGGSDTLLGSSADEAFALNANGEIAVSGIGFEGIASVDAGGGRDSVSGSGQNWASVAQGGALVDGAALATLESITVLFENIEQVQNTGAYAGPAFATDYFLSSPTSLNIGGVDFAGLQSIAAGSGDDTLHGVDAELSWTLDSRSGTLSDGQSSLAFSGFEQIVAGAGADTFNLNGGALSALDTGAGNDIVYMNGALLNSLLLGDGDDQVQILAGTQPATLSAGAGSDQLVMQLAGQQWRITGSSTARNTVGEFAFTGFEQLRDTTGGLNLVTSQQLDFTASQDSAGVNFAAAGMALEYNADGDLTLQSSSAATIGGSLRALAADLTLAGDLDIESELQSLSVRSSAGDINVTVLEKDDLEIGQINAGRGNVSLASSSFGLLTAANFRDTHITAGNIVLGYEPHVWGNVGEVIKPLRMDATGTVDLVALNYFDPAFLGQQPEFTATGNKNASIASAQTSQGLKSVIQNPVDDIAQLDPGIFSEVTPYSLGIDVLNLPEVRLLGGELVPMDEGEDERRRKQPMAVGGN